MCGTMDDLMTFWLTPWSKPLREACVWVTRFGPPLSGKKPDTEAPKWVRPLFLQRWVAQAIAERLAWLDAHPDLADDRFGQESETDWEHVTWTFAEPRCLRELCEATLLWMFNCEVERLLRIIQEPPTLVGSCEWTQAALVACGHIAQVYAELRRRQPAGAGYHKAKRARAIVREELRRFVTWQRAGEPSGD